MTIELNLATLICVCSCIITVGGAIKVLTEAKKALQKPIAEINDKLEHYDQCLDRDKLQLDKLDSAMTETAKSINMLVDIDLTMLRHMSNGNNTGEINEKIKKIEDWLFSGKEYKYE